MRLQKDIWLPDGDKWPHWNKNFELKEYRSLHLRGKLAIDIGAHVGIWTQRLAKDFEQVICFEPLPKHQECHKKNCEDLDNVKLFEYGLSNENSKQVMTTKNSNSGQSSLLSDMFLKTESRTEVEVETRTLDSFDLPKMDFIKIDVEGWEYYMLLGAKETIQKYLPNIYIEVWDENYDTISELFNSWGYSSFYRYKDTANYLVIHETKKTVPTFDELFD